MSVFAIRLEHGKSKTNLLNWDGNERHIFIFLANTAHFPSDFHCMLLLGL